MGISVTGLPGYRTERTHTPRRIRNSDANVSYLPGGAIINGSLSGDAGNTGNLDVLRPGEVMGKQASGGKWRNAIWGVSTAAYVDNDLSITVSAATATEIARIKAAAGGGNLSAFFVGPPSAAGTVAATAITITAVGATTITVADLNLAKVTGSLICAADVGADSTATGIWTLIDDNDYIALSDQDNTRIDAQFNRPLTSGFIDSSQILDWPADTSTQDWLKGKLSGTTGVSSFTFDDDI